MATLYEYCNTGADGQSGADNDDWLAQTFTPSVTHKITSVKLLLYREGVTGYPGTIVVGIWATDENEHPVGGDLCSGTTDGDTLPEGTGDPDDAEWREITLDNGYNLSANTKYAIVIRAPDALEGDLVDWCEDESSSAYGAGNWEYSSDSGETWEVWTDVDFMFEDWGEPEATNITITLTDVMPATGADTTPISLVQADVDAVMTSTGDTVSPTGIVSAILVSVMSSIGDTPTPVSIIQAVVASVMASIGDSVIPGVNVIATPTIVMMASGDDLTPSIIIQAVIGSVMAASGLLSEPTLISISKSFRYGKTIPSETSTITTKPPGSGRYG